MKVSVALCTCNGEKYLAEQLDSILHQVLVPDEIVASDDFSIDKTVEILKSYRQRYKHVLFTIMENKERIGVLRNFEQAIKATTGDIIFLCDQDDVWLPNKTQELVVALQERKDKDVVFSNATLMGMQEGTLWEFVRFNKNTRNDWEKYGSLYAFLRYKSICTGASMALKKEAKNYIFPFVDTPFLIHDGWIGVAAAVQDRIFFVDKRLYQYRIHDQQWTQLNTGRTDSSKKEDLLLKTSFLRYFIDFYSITDQNIQGLYLHYKRRTELSGSAFRKVIVVCKEVFNGNYKRYSNGLPSAVRDLLF